MIQPHDHNTSSITAVRTLRRVALLVWLLANTRCPRDSTHHLLSYRLIGSGSMSCFRGPANVLEWRFSSSVVVPIPDTKPLGAQCAQSLSMKRIHVVPLWLLVSNNSFSNTALRPLVFSIHPVPVNSALQIPETRLNALHECMGGINDHLINHKSFGAACSQCARIDRRKPCGAS